jgi:cytochrome c oxidase subunit 4
MDGITLTLWIMTGTFVGGVVTPLIPADRAMNDWLAMLIGVIVGGIGNVVLLIPLWAALYVLLPKSEDQRLAWERDAMSAEEAKAALGTSELTVTPLTLFMKTLWPTARTDGHSHRMSFVSVFVALAIITVIEVVITVIDAGNVTKALLVAFSMTKVLLVVMFFMHLRYDSKWYSSIFAYAFPFAALITIVLALA